MTDSQHEPLKLFFMENHIFLYYLLWRSTFDTFSWLLSGNF